MFSGLIYLVRLGWWVNLLCVVGLLIGVIVFFFFFFEWSCIGVRFDGVCYVSGFVFG